MATWVKTIGTTDAGAGAATVLTITVPAGGVAQGHSIIAGVVRGATTFDVSATDSVGNTYILDATVLNSTVGVFVGVFRCSNAIALTAGQTITFTATGTAKYTFAAIASEWADIGVVDVVAGSSTGSSSSPDSGSTAGVHGGSEAVIGYIWGMNTNATTETISLAGTGWTPEISDSWIAVSTPNQNDLIYTQHQISLVAGTTYDCNATLNTSSFWASICVVYLDIGTLTRGVKSTLSPNPTIIRRQADIRSISSNTIINVPVVRKFVGSRTALSTVVITATTSTNQVLKRALSVSVSLAATIIRVSTKPRPLSASVTSLASVIRLSVKSPTLFSTVTVSSVVSFVGTGFRGVSSNVSRNATIIRSRARSFALNTLVVPSIALTKQRSEVRSLSNLIVSPLAAITRASRYARVAFGNIVASPIVLRIFTKVGTASDSFKVNDTIPVSQLRSPHTTPHMDVGFAQEDKGIELPLMENT